jgi:hypothetical protein
MNENKCQELKKMKGNEKKNEKKAIRNKKTTKGKVRSKKKK